MLNGPVSGGMWSTDFKILCFEVFILYATRFGHSGCPKYVPFGLSYYHLKMKMHNGMKRIKLMTTAISSLERLE